MGVGETGVGEMGVGEMGIPSKSDTNYNQYKIARNKVISELRKANQEQEKL